MPLILSPAEESLTRYYEKLGFKNAFQGEHKNVSGSDITALEVKDTEPVACMEPVTPEEYVRIRDEKCAKEGYVHWDVDAVSYAMELAASCGGGTAAVSCEDKNARNEQEDDRDILMYDIREKELVILETTLSDDALSQVLPQLMEETGTSAASYGRERGMIWLPETMADLPVAGDGYSRTDAWLMNFQKNYEKCINFSCYKAKICYNITMIYLVSNKRQRVGHHEN